MSKVNKVIVEKTLKDAVKESVRDYKLCEEIVGKGEKVLLKVNFNTADEPPASTDINFLETVIEIVNECKPSKIFVGDSSTFSQKTEKVMKKKGVYKLEKKYKNVKIINFDKFDWKRKTIKNAKYLKKVSVTEWLDRVDKIILLPCLKTHFIAAFTGSLKLAVGFMKPVERMGLHLRKVQEKVAELNNLFTPDLVILDARKCFITKGPSSGEVREPGLILSSKSRVDIDIEGVKIIQSFDGNDLRDVLPKELPQIKRSLEIGI